jgi:phosphate-selective porin OprO/OprP
MRKYNKAFRGALVLCVGLNLSQVHGRETNVLEVIERLQHRVDELEAKLKTLESVKAGKGIADNEKPSSQPLPGSDEQPERKPEGVNTDSKAQVLKISAGENGFALGVEDGTFNLQLKGLLQADSRTFFDDSGVRGNDGILLRRARPILQGTVYRDFTFQFAPDFGGNAAPQIFDAWINYAYSPEIQLQAGKYKVPVGLEMLQPDQYTSFNERALPTALVPNRDLGFELHGDLWGGALSYAAGIFNGVGDGRVSSNFDGDDNKEFAGRIFSHPFRSADIPMLKNLGFGLGGSYEKIQGTNIANLPATTGGTLAGFTTDGQQQFFAYNPASNSVVVPTGEHWRLSPQAYYFYGPLSLMGEYVISDQKIGRIGASSSSVRLENTAWEATAGWVLTGEDATYAAGVTPRRNFNPREGGWGAWQLVARYAQLDVDPHAFPLYSNPTTSARSVDSWSLGVDWYLNRNIYVKTSFSHADFHGGGGAGAGAPAAVTRKDENVLFTRLQLSF